MIDQALNLLIDDLNTHLGQRYTINPLVSLYNIASPDWKSLQPNNTSTGQIFANLINVHENAVYKNQPAQNGHGISVLPMRMDLYILFAFKSQQYLQSLKLLSAVLEYYHRKRVHNLSLVDFSSNTVNLSLEINYHSIDLEDSNNMWSNLGGEQYPFAMYRIQLMEIMPNVTTAPASIQTININ